MRKNQLDNQISADEQFKRIEEYDRNEVEKPVPDYLSEIDQMTREQLLELIKLVAGAIWGYALLDDEQKAEAARLKLYNLGMSASEVHKAVPALDKWFDRTQGKPAQSIAMTVKQEPVTKLTDDQLAALLAQLPDPLIIPPLSKL